MTKKIIDSYVGGQQLDYLFSLLAPDVYLLGPGENMQAEGRKKAEYVLSKSLPYLYPCSVSQDRYLSKRIGNEYWLCEAVCALEIRKPDAEPLHKGLHLSLLYRRCKDVEPGGIEWEVAHIHGALTTSLLSSEDMLQIQLDSKNRRKPHVYAGLTDREIKLVRMLRSGMPIRDMAKECGQAEITVKKALAKLYQRYNRKNRSRLCAYFDALEHDY